MGFFEISTLIFFNHIYILSATSATAAQNQTQVTTSQVSQPTTMVTSQVSQPMITSQPMTMVTSQASQPIPISLAANQVSQAMNMTANQVSQAMTMATNQPMAMGKSMM